MRWLKHTVSILLILAAVAVAMATAFTNHSADYGSVPLPQGGVVQLPEGRVIVYYRQGASQAPGATFAFQVTPVAGGAPVPLTSDNGTQIAGADQRSQTIGEMGAVAKLDVPSAGEYDVSGSGDIAQGAATLEFGTNAGAAVLARWKLIAGLFAAALLIALIPTPRSKRRWEDETGDPPGWSSDPRAPYAG